MPQKLNEAWSLPQAAPTGIADKELLEVFRNVRAWEHLTRVLLDEHGELSLQPSDVKVEVCTDLEDEKLVTVIDVKVEVCTDLEDEKLVTVTDVKVEVCTDQVMTWRTRSW